MQKPQAAQKAYSVAISGCSSARLEYTSGGRGVAGSNPVIPTLLNTRYSIEYRVFFFIYTSQYIHSFNQKYSEKTHFT